MAGFAGPALLTTIPILTYESLKTFPFSSSRRTRPHSRPRRSSGSFPRSRIAAASRLQPARVHRRRGRTGGQRQDGTDAAALLALAGETATRGGHERHLHERRRRVSDEAQSAGGRANSRG